MKSRKLKKKILLGSLLSTLIVLPTITLLSCNSVNGKLSYEIVGLNKNKTDFIIKIKLDKQYIAKVIEKNRDDKNRFFNEIKNKILKDIKDVFPDAYKTGIFKNEIPSVLEIDKTTYEIYFPINEFITNLPKIDNIIKDFKKKYNKMKDIIKIRKELEDKILFEINLLEKDKKKLEKEIKNKYDISYKDEKEIEDKDIVDFHYLGISPYMSEKLTNDILKNIFGKLKNNDGNPYKNVEELLNENFDGKLNMEQIQKTVLLSSKFELKQWQNQNAKVIFYILNIKEKNPLYKLNSLNSKQKEEYSLIKDLKKSFSTKNKNKAEIYYSLFLEKNITPKNSETIEIEINDKRKIEESTTKDIFVGLKKGVGHSKPILINRNRFTIEFDSNSQPINDDLIKYFVEANLGIKKENDKNQNLHQIKYNDKYEAIISFDIEEILSKDKDGNWVNKTKNDVVKIGDKIIYSNSKIDYIGNPFKGGESTNGIQGKNHMMFIDIEGNKSGFIKGFDKLMVDNKIKILKSNFITPIFPSNYKTKNLAGKLVIFKIKVNRIIKRKKLNNQFFIDNDITNNVTNEKILNNNDLWEYINQKFKQDLLVDIITNYCSKANYKIPYIKIEKKFNEAYQKLYVQNLKNSNKKKPNIEEVKKHAEDLAALEAKFDQFLRDNKFWDKSSIKRNKNLLSYIYSKIS